MPRIKFIGRRRALIGVVALLATIGAASVAAGATGDDGESGLPQGVNIEDTDAGKATGAYDYAEQTEAPDPKALLRSTSDVLDCFSRYDLTVFGPVPAADGSGFEYATEDGPRFREADEQCTPSYLSVSGAFSELATEDDRAVVRQMRTTLIDCLASSAPQLERGLTGGSYQVVDEALRDASLSANAPYQTCVDQLTR